MECDPGPSDQSERRIGRDLARHRTGRPPRTLGAETFSLEYVYFWNIVSRRAGSTPRHEFRRLCLRRSETGIP